jgi:hypothetical protein
MRVRCAIASAVALGLASCPASVLAGSGDTATTNTYLRADYALVKTVSAQLPRSQAALLGLLAHVRQSCPLAAISSPQDSQSTQLSDELIGAMVLSGGHVDRQAVRAYTTKVNGLRWSNQQVNREIHNHISDLQTLLGLQVPDICADVKSWASSGFKVLTVRTVQFAATFIEGWVRPGNQPAQLASSEGPSGRALAQRAERLEWRITDFESAAVETWGAIMDALVLSP